MAQVVGYALIIAGYWYPGLQYAGYAVLAADAYEQNKRAQRRAKAEYNASLQDRLEMVDVTPDAPRTLALGRVRAVEGVRRKWVSGENSQRLTMVVSFAGHEIDGFETFYFNDQPLTLDDQGYVLTEPFSKGALSTFQSGQYEVGAGGFKVINITAAFVAGTVTAYQVSESGDTEVPVSLDGTVATVGPADFGAMVYLSYQVPSYKGTARIRFWTGAPGQNVGAAIAADYPGKITSSDRFEGMAVAVVDIDYDPDVYVQGRPNVTALFRGARCYDPRLDSTAGGSGDHRQDDPTTWEWTENPALHALHYATHANGWAVPAAEVRMADMAEAADVCDTSTEFTLRVGASTSTVTLPRYRCGITISTAGDPREAMNEIVESMAGRSGWAGGSWRLKAGHMPTPVFDISESWLARPVQADGRTDTGPVIQFTNGVPREQKVNRVTGSCVNPAERYQVLPFPAVQDSVLITAEGAVYPLEVQYQGVNHIAHAQHLGTVAIRQSQAALRATASCNLQAYPVELFDVGRLSLARYGMSAKTMEVRGWAWQPGQGVTLQLAEITEAIFEPVDELTGQDPAPNSNLPPPWQVEQLTGLAVTSGTDTLTDGSVLTRTRVAWDAAVGESIRAGGKVQVQYIEVAAELPDDWPVWEEAGSATSAVIPALRSGYTYLFRARFVSAPPLAVRGVWGLQVAHTVALPPTVPGRYTDFVFRRSATLPSTPTGTGTPADWFGSPPAADGNPLWVSIAEKNGDGSLIGTWSTPVQIDGDSVQVEYSVDGATDWHGTFTPGDIYARYRTGNTGDWQGPVKIVGEDGTTTSYIFKRSASAPATPTGDVPSGWYDEPPAADGNPLWASLGAKTPGGTLLGVWSTPVQIEGDSVQVQYSVDGVTSWHDTFTSGDKWARYRIGPTGAWSDAVKIVGEDGANGRRTALLEFFIWSVSTPTTFPSGTSTYTWASATYTAPSTPAGWAVAPGAAVPGQTLWACAVRYSDTNTTTTSTVTVAPGSAYAVGFAGSNGAAGNSAVVAYALYTGNPTVTGSAVTTSGTATPATTAFSPTAASSFTYAVQTPGSGQAMFVTDGIYDPVANTTTWGTPYLANLKVATLDAITGNMGTLNAGSINTTGYLRADGYSTLSVLDPNAPAGPAVPTTVAMVGNFSEEADIGVLGITASTAENAAGIYGYSLSTTAGAGVTGYGLVGVKGRAAAVDESAGIDGQAAESTDSAGVRGMAAGEGTYGGWMRRNILTGGRALRIDDELLDPSPTGETATWDKLPDGVAAGSQKWLRMNWNGQEVIVAGYLAPLPAGDEDFFGENLAPSSTVVGDPVTARDAFLAALDTTNVATWGFEDQSTGGIGGSREATYYDEAGDPYTVTLTGVGTIVSSAADGRFNTTPSGANYLRVQQGQSVAFESGIPAIPLAGPDLGAFGFFATDTSDYTGQLSLVLTFVGGATETVVVPHTVSSGSTNSGSLIFFGVIRATPMTGVQIVAGYTSGSATTSDYVGIDDVIVGTTGQVL